MAGRTGGGGRGVNLAELIDLLGLMATTPSSGEGGFSELDHALQCAHELAQHRLADPELQVAGLMHDVGHQFGADDVHASVGAELVRPLFGARIAGLVEAHVTAKRYLITAEPGYAGVLSDMSTETLALQGGPLTIEEASAFEASPYFGDALTLRRADDAAKVAGRLVPPLEHWIPIVTSLAR
jgi:predicted HD phosphohydrolase